MSEIKYCNLCNRNVQPKKKFNWISFVIWLIIAFGVPYLLYYWFVKEPVCPICDGKVFSPMQIDELGKKSVIT